MPAMYFKITQDGEIGKEKVFFVRIYDHKPTPDSKAFDIYECHGGECDEDTLQYLTFERDENDETYQKYLTDISTRFFGGLGRE